MDVLHEAVAARSRREPFVLATVVWRRGPSSAQVGGKAIIGAGGQVRGWLGGACAEPEMVVQALQALADGQPRLVLLGQPDDLDEPPRLGRHTIAMACDSEGAVEIYLEPHLPTAQVVVMGGSPAAHALASIAASAGWAVEHVSEPSLEGVIVDSATAVVVMSQGHFDDLALAEALATEAGYIGLVASQKRAATVIGLLQDGGMCASHTARIHSPAGLDLGRTTHLEMGVAVMADLIARRAAGGLAIHMAGDVAGEVEHPAETAIDPVCGMTVVVADSHYVAEHEGVRVHFCAAGCRAAFLADPASFTG